MSNDLILKIMASVGDKRRVMDAIRRFKNERFPNIVVTVDLLTTGVDVLKIDTLVFMRRVKSRILFEQMLGRATRLCPEIGKTHFRIFDAVGVYESLEQVSDMKTVVTSPAITFSHLLNELNSFDDDKAIRHAVNQVIAKLRRLSFDEEIKEITNKLRSLSTQDAKGFLLSREKFYGRRTQCRHFTDEKRRNDC